jgi:integrase
VRSRKAINSQNLIELFGSVVEVKSQPTLESYRNRNHLYWRINLGQDATGKTVRRQIGKDEGHARQVLAEILQRLSNGDIQGVKSAFEVYSDHEIKAALKKLRHYNTTLPQAISFFIKHHRPNKGLITLEQALQIWKENAQQLGYSDTYIKKMLNTYAGPFVKLHSGFKLIDITYKEAENYIFKQKSSLSNYSKAQTISKLRGFFNTLADLEYFSKELNPFEKLKLPKAKFGEAEEKNRIIPSVVIKEKLEFALSSNKPGYHELLVAMVLMSFCGARKTEVFRLEWQHIDRSKSVWKLLIPNLQAKWGYKRTIVIPDNAKAWLEEVLKKIPNSNGRFLNSWRNGRTSTDLTEEGYSARFTRFRKAFKKHCEENGKTWEKYEQNGFRVSCASYGLEHFGLEKICRMMGERRDPTFWNHYRESCEEEEAETFFSIIPTVVAERWDLAAYEQACEESNCGQAIKEGDVWLPILNEYAC